MKTPLHIAVLEETAEAVSQVSDLLSQGNNFLNVVDDDLGAPLHLAIDAENIQVVKLLVEAGADLTVRDWNRDTPLHYAVRHNNADIVKILLKAGADITTNNEDLKNPVQLLMLRAKENAIYKKEFVIDECARLLIESINLTTKNGAEFLINNYSISARFPPAKRLYYKFLIEHLAKLYSMNQKVHSRITDFVLNTILKQVLFRDYFIKCRFELIKAKDTKLNNCWVTFHNLIVDHESKFVKYAGNEDLKKDFEENVKNFPIYGAVMRSNTKKGIDQRKLLDKAVDVLSCCLPIFDPTHLIIRDTLDLFNAEDWEKICENFDE